MYLVLSLNHQLLIKSNKKQNMKIKEILIKVSFYVAFIITIIGTFFKIYHWNEASAIMAIGLLTSTCFIIFSILEVANSDKISRNEKSMWVFGLIFITPLVGFIYILSARKRIIIKNSKS